MSDHEVQSEKSGGQSTDEFNEFLGRIGMKLHHEEGGDIVVRVEWSRAQFFWRGDYLCLRIAKG